MPAVARCPICHLDWITVCRWVSRDISSVCSCNCADCLVLSLTWPPLPAVSPATNSPPPPPPPYYHRSSGVSYRCTLFVTPTPTRPLATTLWPFLQIRLCPGPSTGLSGWVTPPLGGTSCSGCWQATSLTSPAVVRESAGPTVHPPPPHPPPSHQKPTTMVLKCTWGCPKHDLTCSPDRHWDALELIALCTRVPSDVEPVADWAQLTNTTCRSHTHYCFVIQWHKCSLE